MQQLESCEQAQQRWILRGLLVGYRAPPPVREGRPEAFSAAQYKLLQRGSELAIVGANVGGVSATLFDVLAELTGDGMGQLPG